MEISRNVKVAFVVGLGILCFVLGISFLKSKSFFTKGKEMYAMFDHSVGLQEGAKVTLNGVNVGNVLSLELDPETSRIRINFSIKEDVQFSKNSVAQVYSSPLGASGLQIIPAKDGAPKAEDGQMLNSSIKLGLMDEAQEQLGPTSSKLSNTLDSADSLLVNINSKVDKTLDKKAQDDVRESLHNLNVAIKKLNEITQNIQKVLVNSKLDQSLENVNKVTNNLNTVSEDLKKANLSATVAKMDAAVTKVNSIIDGVESGKGSMGLLMKDPKLYNNLKSASSELNLLLEDVRLNPKRYISISVFGKKQEPYKAPERKEENSAMQTKENK